jgi:epidermal growth factor receptor substrate 15
MSRVGDDGAIGHQPPPSAPFPFAPAATEAIASDSLAPAEGAFPESDLAEVPTDTTPKPMPGSSSALVHPDPFGTTDQEKAKADFENAFASFTKAHNNKSPDKPPTEADTAFSNFNTEFPPIAELDRDEDSETASEQGGFDDDFAPSPPNRKSRDKVEIGEKPEIGSGTGGSLDAFPPVTLGNVVVDEQVPDAR